MKIGVRSFMYLAALFFGAACSAGHEPLTRASLEQGFVTPPDSVKIGVYWYWISGNISKEGVVKDLEAMKRAGINLAFIGNIQAGPEGKVKFYSEEWWDILHAALKRAGELDIEIGIFNSPGWSQSGGPWVQPSQAMRYLNASQLRVKGPQRLDVQLAQPDSLFEDVRVIAYPAPKNDGVVLKASDCRLTAIPAVADLPRVMDGDTTTSVVLPMGETVRFDLSMSQPFTARSLILRPGAKPLVAECLLQVRDGANYRTLSTFTMDRRTLALNVGFDPTAPLVISFGATRASDYRLLVTNKGNTPGALAEIELSSAPRLDHYSEKSLAKMYPSPLPYWHEYQWQPQPAVDDPTMVIAPQSVQDISQSMNETGHLVWDVPAGEWVILRTGMTPTGTTNSPATKEATGLETDKMSKKHIEAHFDAFLGEILKRIPERDRKSFKVVVQDSYETGGQNFTDDFLERFRDRYGYDPLPYLPAYYGYVVGSPEASDRFLWDVRRLVADCVAYDYVGGLREVSHRHGLTTWLENYGHWGFPGEFLQYGGQSDGIGGEFWAEGTLGNIENRAAASCGHIYGKNKISAESFTGSGRVFERYPGLIKYRGDRFFSEGINQTIMHVYISQPNDSMPGVNAWFNTEFNRHNTWFSQMDQFVTYLKRCNFMLQQGLNRADAAYFIGEDAPKMTGVLDPSIPVGYQYDFINAEVILNRLTVVNGMLTLPHGTQYRILVLPKLETMRPELLARIKELVAAGAVVLGPPPTHSPSLQNQPTADASVTEMAAELWGKVDGVKVKSAKYGKGMILNGMTMEEAFALIGCEPDCRLPAGTPVMYNHRQAEGIDLYFVTNQSDRPVEVSPVFRVNGRQPELWSPVSGQIRLLTAFTQQGKGTEIPLKLAPYESVFVVFADPTQGNGKGENYPPMKLISQINGPWDVTFDSAMRGPVKPVLMQQLRPWNQMEPDSIRYYSGTAVYNSSFDLAALPSQGERLVLDLGAVGVMAKVYLNGTLVGGVWTAPYSVDVTDYAKAGTNALQIEVVNGWKNRLVGDSRLPEQQRRTWTVVNPITPQDALQLSGLIGPVALYQVSYVFRPEPKETK